MIRFLGVRCGAEFRLRTNILLEQRVFVLSPSRNFGGPYRFKCVLEVMVAPQMRKSVFPNLQAACFEKSPLLCDLLKTSAKTAVPPILHLVFLFFSPGIRLA